VNATLLRPLPYADPGRLVLLSAAQAAQPDALMPMSLPGFEQIRARSHSFSAVAAFAGEFFNLTAQGEPEQVPAARVSSNFFDVLGTRPLLGRTFTAEEGTPGSRRVVLLSYGLWMRAFGGDRTIVGRTVRLDDRDDSVIGVLPHDFDFQFLGSDVGIWTPRVFELNVLSPQQIQAGAGYLDAVARLRPGITLRQARIEMDALNSQYQSDHPGAPDAGRGLSIDVGGFQQRLVSHIRTAMLILLAAVGLVLLVTCGNVASLVLSRLIARRRDLAVRVALGASRGALVRLLLAESLLLAALGSAVGLLVGWSGTHALMALARDNYPQLAGAGADPRVFAFTAAISILSGILVGTLPTLQLSGTGPGPLLRDEGRGSVGSRRRDRLRRLLVVAQVALAMVLLVGAGLLVRSFIRLQTVSPGFDPAGVLTMQIVLPTTKYPTAEAIVRFYDEALRRTRTLPGVQAAAISSALPLSLSRMSPVLLEGHPSVPLGQRPVLDIQAISPDYPRVMHVPLLSGRLFTERDGPAAPHVAIVNQALVRRFWPDVNPVGQHV